MPDQDNGQDRDYRRGILAGLEPHRAERYARHCDTYRALGKTPLTPEQAADAPRTVR